MKLNKFLMSVAMVATFTTQTFASLSEAEKKNVLDEEQRIIGQKLVQRNNLEKFTNETLLLTGKINKLKEEIPYGVDGGLDLTRMTPDNYLGICDKLNQVILLDTELQALNPTVALTKYDLKVQKARGDFFEKLYNNRHQHFLNGMSRMIEVPSRYQDGLWDQNIRQNVLGNIIYTAAQLYPYMLKVVNGDLQWVTDEDYQTLGVQYWSNLPEGHVFVSNAMDAFRTQLQELREGLQGIIPDVTNFYYLIQKEYDASHAAVAAINAQLTVLPAQQQFARNMQIANFPINEFKNMNSFKSLVEAQAKEMKELLAQKDHQNKLKDVLFDIKKQFDALIDNVKRKGMFS